MTTAPVLPPTRPPTTPPAGAADAPDAPDAPARPTRRTGPTLRLERKFWDAGDEVVCGIDEVGRGAWAGPVTVAAVVPAPEHVRGVRDSKQLDPRPSARRRRASVRRWAVAIGVGHASHEECDELGHDRRAARRRLAGARAARRAGLRPRSHRARRQPRLPRAAVAGHHRDQGRRQVPRGGGGVVRGEGDARPHDDRRRSEHYPPYDFESNVGYPAPAHKTALAGYGPSAIHRRSWIFMDSLCWRGVPPAPGRLFL